MTITKAEILAFVNRALEGSYSGTDLDIDMQACLDDLAGMHCLRTEDATQTLTNASDYLVYPSDCLDTEQAIISVVLRDANDVRGKPLLFVPGGWQEYQRLMENASYSSRSDPTHMVMQDRRIYLYPAPGEDYTTSIWYFKRHQALASGIEFPDDWRLGVYFGCVYFTALMTGDKENVALWEPRYLAKKEELRISIPRDSGIVGA